MSNKNQHQAKMLGPFDSPLGTRFERTFAARNISDPAERFRPQAFRRLYLAIVNRAILDVLENGKNSPAAKRWLLSRDFEGPQELFY